MSDNSVSMMSVPKLKRMISSELLKEIKQQDYVGIPEYVADTLNNYQSGRSSFNSLMPQNSEKVLSFKKDCSDSEVIRKISIISAGATNDSESVPASSLSKSKILSPFVFFE